MQVGIVMSGVEAQKIKALILPEYIRSGEPLLNLLVKIPYKSGFAVGVIVAYKGVNPLYENGAMVRQFAQIVEYENIAQALKERREYYEADILLLSAFSGQVRRIAIDSPIAVGAQVSRLEPSDITIKGKGVYYLGRFQGSDFLQPLYIQDFQTLREAYHFVVAGQTGSGKSTLAMMLMCLYAKASQNAMNFVILSPVPEFVNAFKGVNVGSFGLNVGKVFESLGYEVEFYNEDNIALDSWDLLEELLLIKDIWMHLEIKTQEHKRHASKAFINLARRDNVPLSKLHLVPQETMKYVLSSQEFINYVYAQAETKNRLRNAINSPTHWSNFYSRFSEVLKLFGTSGRVSVANIVSSLASAKKRVLVIDFGYGGDFELQSLLLKRLIDLIREKGENLYRENPDLNLNTLILLDEAHNFAPSKVDEDEKRQALKNSIVRAFAETRKFGIGWMAISTRISLLDRKIYEHARVKILGYGLTTGADRDILREDFNKDIIDRYLTFSDPSDPLSKRRHSFLIYGPITLLSRGQPEILEAFSSASEFLQLNRFFSSGSDISPIL